jgi:catechol 2,3-dioxygenase-like lactoylglutathione lyase family enzyme
VSEPEVAVAAPPAAEFGGAVPILRVADLDASLVYYAGALGFEPEWRAGSVASVRRGRASLMLCQGDQGHPGTWVWLGVSDADVLHEELLARGVAIRHPPTNYPWGSRELHVADPDGNVLRLGADLRPGEPYGPWLDGAGVRWLPDHEGGWRPAA